MTGSEANAQNQAINSVIEMGTVIFGAIGANKYVSTRRFKDEDVVIQETARDNHAFIVTGASVLLLVTVIVVLLR